MAQWGNKKRPVNVTANTTVETTEGAPIGVWSLVNKGGGPNAHFGNTSGTRAVTDLDIYADATPGRFIPGAAIGVYGYDAGEMNTPGVITDIELNVGENGSFYDPDQPGPSVNIVMANGTVNRSAAYGDVAYQEYAMEVPGTVVEVMTPGLPLAGVNKGFAYWTDPSPEWSIYANTTSVSKAAGGLLGGFKFPGKNITRLAGRGELFYYHVPDGETPLAPLSANTWYRCHGYEQNNTVMTIADRYTNQPITITDFRGTVTAPAPRHYITGEDFQIHPPTFQPGADVKGTHPGWVVRKEGTGGRTGRIQYECLVAMGKMANN
jgi:hypothetical protein